MGDFSTTIKGVEQKLEDGVNKFGRIKIGIAYHSDGESAQVTVKNSESVPGRFGQEWLGEGESIEIAGINITHKRSTER